MLEDGVLEIEDDEETLYSAMVSTLRMVVEECSLLSSAWEWKTYDVGPIASAVEAFRSHLAAQQLLQEFDDADVQSNAGLHELVRATRKWAAEVCVMAVGDDSVHAMGVYSSLEAWPVEVGTGHA